MKALLIGEARGERELRFDHGFVGPSGRELARMIAVAGLAPPLDIRYPNEQDMVAHWARLRSTADIGIANVFEAHPPGNDIGEFFGRDGDRSLPRFKVANKAGYVLPEYAIHVHHLYDKIARERPTLIIALGNSACWAVLGETKISALRGTVQMSARFGIKTIPTYHPAAVLRQFSLRPVTIADLTKAARHAEFPEIRRTERWITIVDPTGAGLRAAGAWFNRPAEKYAIDIETAFGQISMVGFARSRHDALVIPFHNPDGSSYWPNIESEVLAWQLVRHGLQSPVPKRFQNGVYDIGYFLRMGLVPRYGAPGRPGGDTMLRHHATFLESPKSLGFLGSLYCDEISWKTMRTTNADTKRDE